MRVGKRVGDLACEAHRFVDRKLLLARESCTKRFALDIGHDVVEQPGRVPGVVEGKDVWVPEPRDDLDLLLEALDANAGRELGAKHLDGDTPVMLQILREVDPRHSTDADLSLEPVARAQRVGECTCVRREHCRDGLWETGPADGTSPRREYVAPPRGSHAQSRRNASNIDDVPRRIGNSQSGCHPERSEGSRPWRQHYRLGPDPSLRSG